MSWHVLARHKWIVGATVTESVNDGDTLRRYTATVRGYRNWRIFEGAAGPGYLALIIRIACAIRDQIDANGENCEAFMATNKYSRSVPELEARAEIFEHPISEALEIWLESL